MEVPYKNQKMDVRKEGYIVGKVSYPYHSAERICKKLYHISKKYPDIYRNEKLAKRIDGIVKNCENGYVIIDIFRVTGKIKQARLELYKLFIELAEVEDLNYNLETWSSKSKNLRVYGISFDIF